MNLIGTVTSRTKGFYYLINEQNEETECKVKGNLFKDSRYDNQIAVGDRVTYKICDDAKIGLINSIEKRKSFLSRNRVGTEAEQIIASNIDYLLITMSTTNPDFRTNLVNRMLVAAAIGNITPVLIITKTDLVNNQRIQQLVEPYRSVDLEIILSSTKDSTVNPRIIEIMSNSVSVLSGQSGVGKSSLLNKLFPGLMLKVGDVGEKTLKGSHTTTFARMYKIAENSFVIDTPGLREFGLWKVTQENLSQYYPVISEYINGCKHRNCQHIHEPQCAVKQAVENKEIHETLYHGYVSIYNSLNS